MQWEDPRRLHRRSKKAQEACAFPLNGIRQGALRAPAVQHLFHSYLSRCNWIGTVRSVKA